MAGVFDFDGGGGLHGALLSRKMNETETKDLIKVFQKAVLSYFYHNTSFPASFFRKEQRSFFVNVFPSPAAVFSIVRRFRRRSSSLLC